MNRKNEKNRGGNFETPKIRKKRGVGILRYKKNGTTRRAGLLFFCSIERGFNGSRLTVHRGGGHDIGGNIESQK